ncbi:MAG: DUF1579 domain-containing protein [Verrucomicrobiota bacterium]
MKTLLPLVTALIAIVLTASSSLAQETSASPAAATAATAATTAGAPNDAEMMKQMMELSKLGENHKILAGLAGTWSYTVKMWMNPDPSAKPEESKGTATRKPTMDGRFFVLDVTGKMEMPGPDGKKKEMIFKGMGIEGYDNVKKKFVSTWMDNMGTGVMMSEGSYDPASKTFTYTGDYEAIPGMKTQIRETVKVTDKDHHTFEMYENRSGKEVKTVEINYRRKK